MDPRIVTLVLSTLYLSAAQRQAAPQYPAGNVVPILSQNFELNPDGSYQFSYESGDGSGRQETGEPRALGPEGPAVVAQGSYKYVSDTGPVSVNYVADENGYQPVGDNIHPSILKAVAYLVAEAKKGPAPGGPPATTYRPYVTSPQALFGKK